MAWVTVGRADGGDGVVSKDEFGFSLVVRHEKN